VNTGESVDRTHVRHHCDPVDDVSGHGSRWSGEGVTHQSRPSEAQMELLLFLIVVFLVFMVAGWGWRRGRSGV
jgi:hypothetical protein